jgi:hypothetical protein
LLGGYVWPNFDAPEPHASRIVDQGQTYLTAEEDLEPYGSTGDHYFILLDDLLPPDPLPIGIDEGDLDSSFGPAYIDASLHTESSNVIEFIRNENRTSVFAAIQTANQQHPSSNDYWAVYGISAYECDPTLCNDPEDAYEVLGLTGTVIAEENNYSVSFYETIRDAAEEWGANPGELQIHNWIHEFGHTFGPGVVESNMEDCSEPDNSVMRTPFHDSDGDTCIFYNFSPEAIAYMRGVGAP